MARQLAALSSANNVFSERNPVPCAEPLANPLLGGPRQVDGTFLKVPSRIAFELLLGTSLGGGVPVLAQDDAGLIGKSHRLRQCR